MSELVVPVGTEMYYDRPVRPGQIDNIAELLVGAEVCKVTDEYWPRVRRNRERTLERLTIIALDMRLDVVEQDDIQTCSVDPDWMIVLKQAGGKRELRSESYFSCGLKPVCDRLGQAAWSLEHFLIPADHPGTTEPSAVPEPDPVRFGRRIPGLRRRALLRHLAAA